jgi:hypothetical protein
MSRSATISTVPVLSIDLDDPTAGITIREVQPNGSRLVGTFHDAAAAWAAVDQLDAPPAPAQPAAPVRRPAARERRARLRLSGALRRRPADITG